MTLIEAIRILALKSPPPEFAGEATFCGAFIGSEEDDEEDGLYVRASWLADPATGIGFVTVSFHLMVPKELEDDRASALEWFRAHVEAHAGSPS